jgi:hypothetical protein
MPRRDGLLIVGPRPYLAPGDAGLSRIGHMP